MPLNTKGLQAELEALFLGTSDRTPEEAAKYGAEKLAGIIEKYVKTATVTVPAGIPVSVAGTAAAQTGATTAPTTGTVS